MALDLSARISLDGSGFESGLKRIEGAVTHVGETLKNLALGAIGIYGIEQAINSTIEAADKLVDTSRRLGVGLEALQELGYAARQNGADIDQLTGFIEKLNTTRIDPKMFPAFQRLGIGNPESGDVVDLIMKLSGNVRNRSSQEVIGPLREIGGKGAGAVLATLKEDVGALRKEAQEFGIVVGTQDIVVLKYLKDEMVILADAIRAHLIPVIASATEYIVKGFNLIRSAITFYSELSKNGFLKDFLLSLVPGAGVSMNKKLANGILDAAAGAGLQLAQLNMATDKQLAALTAKQKDAERLNESPMLVPTRINSEKPYSDPLLRVGNFLGSSNNPVLSVNQLQLAVLRQIERNTSRVNGTVDQILPPL
jgi:hypothetical protein